MKEKDIIFIEHILESITLIQNYVNQLTKEDFLSLSEKQDAVIRRLAIIGEAAKNISPELKQSYPTIPWQKIIGMRNILIHKYFGVDVELTWNTIQKELPVLKQELLNLFVLS